MSDTAPTEIEKRYADVYRELMAEMRWRRDQDVKYLTIFFAVCAFTIAALIVMLREVSTLTHIHFIAVSAAAALILCIGIACIAKIYAEHREYKRLGPEVIAILDRWGMIASAAKVEPFVFPAEYRKLGNGTGWIKSVVIIFVMLALVAIGWVFLACGCHRKMANQPVEPTAIAHP